MARWWYGYHCDRPLAVALLNPTRRTTHSQRSPTCRALVGHSSLAAPLLLVCCFVWVLVARVLVVVANCLRLVLSRLVCRGASWLLATVVSGISFFALQFLSHYGYVVTHELPDGEVSPPCCGIHSSRGAVARWYRDCGVATTTAGARCWGGV